MDSSEADFVQFCCSAPLCGKVYTSKLSLRRHIDVSHLKKKQTTCPICEKVFASQPNLREHMNLHTGKKPFQCAECPRRFRQASQLSLHKRDHLVGIVRDESQSEDDDDDEDYTKKSAKSSTLVKLRFSSSEQRLPIPELLLNRPSN